MIAKAIPKDPEVQDNYSRLAEYILAAEEKGEKLDKFWIRNCDAGAEAEDLELALIEIEAVRKMKPEIENKTYHVTLSLRPGEREKLSENDLKKIEQTFSEALGYGEHQRVAGTHINTDNFHMHIAFNKVHPKTLKMFTPYKDFEILEQTARKMEKKYGLLIDNGMSDRDFNKPSLSGSARDYEAQTWQQSFQSYLMEHKNEILNAVGKAKNWQELHKALSEFDTGIKKRGNGLAFHHLKGNQAMKASALDRSFSLKALEERFGAFEPSKEQTRSKEKKTGKTYVSKPLLPKHPYTSQLWKRYLMSRKVIPRSTLLGRTAANWKMFLMTEAHADPLAMVLLITHQEVLHMIFGPTGRTPAPVPNAAGPALIPWAKKSKLGKRQLIKEITLKPVRSKTDDLVGLILLDKNRNTVAALGKGGTQKKMKKEAPGPELK